MRTLWIIAVLAIAVTMQAKDKPVYQGDVQDAKDCTATKGTPVYSNGAFTGCLWENKGAASAKCRTTTDKDGGTILECDTPNSSIGAEPPVDPEPTAPAGDETPSTEDTRSKI